MRITIVKDKASDVLFKGKFYRTGVPHEMELSDVLRCAQIYPSEFEIPPTTYDPSLALKEGQINFAADVDMTSGYGGVTYHLLKDSSFDNRLLGRPWGVHDEEIISASQKPLLTKGVCVWHDQPRSIWNKSPFARNIAITPFETTVIPKSWIDQINRFHGLLVPCVQNIEAFQQSGVKIPIDLIHWGVDTNVFHEIDRPEREIFTFGTMGKLTTRKGTDLLITAFQKAFPHQKDVRLLCKSSGRVFQFATKDPRISIQLGEVSHKELIKDFFEQIDCFVFPTRGEGFGLTPLEAMSTGVPAIVTGWAGPVEYMREDVGWAIDYHMVDATVFTEHVYHEECGQWGEPDEDHLIDLLRYAYQNRKEVRAKGKRAAAYVREEWTWEKKIKMYENAVLRMAE